MLAPTLIGSPVDCLSSRTTEQNEVHSIASSMEPLLISK